MLSNNNPFNNKKKEDFNIEEWIDFLAERYGWTYSEIMGLPIPVFFALQDAIKKRNEKERKAMEKK
jgi:hypothetical protein